jgi:alpha-tubulin suppressor-like RCC1 family protein
MGGAGGAASTPLSCSGPNRIAVKAVAAGDAHTCVLMTTGGVRCWGHNREGQLGDGTTTDRSTPPASDVLGGVQAIATGMFHTCEIATSMVGTTRMRDG